MNTVIHVHGLKVRVLFVLHVNQVIILKKENVRYVLKVHPVTVQQELNVVREHILIKKKNHHVILVHYMEKDIIRKLVQQVVLYV